MGMVGDVDRPIAGQTVELGSGTRMPLLGLGTWQLRGRAAVDAVRRALEVGYRHIDTATMYGNESQVGQAIAESGVPRAELFVTTKLPQSHTGRERTTLEESLAALGIDHVDLWLIHWPPGGRARPDVWERLLDAQADGLAVRSGSATTASNNALAHRAPDRRDPEVEQSRPHRRERRDLRLPPHTVRDRASRPSRLSLERRSGAGVEPTERGATTRFEDLNDTRQVRTRYSPVDCPVTVFAGSATDTPPDAMRWRKRE